MKFVRYENGDGHRPGVLLDEQTIVDISSIISDIGPETIGSLAALNQSVVEDARLPRVDIGAVRLLSPVSRPHKIIGIGLNYAEHAAESGAEVPTEPVVFMKATSSMCGPNDDIVFPPSFEKVDWEVELALVVDKSARLLPDEAAALECIAGYFIANDVSERSYQLERGGQWMKGKSADTFSPLGPWLVTPDEIPDVLDLDLRCFVNGEIRQDGSTATMIFSPAHIVWYLSQFMTVEAGDVVVTGTPKGIGLATGTYLHPDDVVELEISGLGRQRQVCRHG